MNPEDTSNQNTNEPSGADFNSNEQEGAIHQKQHDEAADQNNVTGKSGTLATQGDDQEIAENLGGTTNLSIGQLKKEVDPQGENSYDQNS